MGLGGYVGVGYCGMPWAGEEAAEDEEGGRWR